MNKKNINILLFFIGIGVGTTLISKIFNEKKYGIQEQSEKNLRQFLMMNQWVKVKQKNRNVMDFLVEQNYRKIAIYGMGYVGKTLLNELKDSNVKVEYGIDKNAEQISLNVDIYTIEDELPIVDAIVVCAVCYYDEIEEELSKKVNCQIISIEDILYAL